MRRGVGQCAVVDLERHREIAPGNPFRHETDGEFARGRVPEVHDLESTCLSELRVSVLLADEPERHHGVGERHPFAKSVLFRQREVAPAD